MEQKIDADRLVRIRSEQSAVLLAAAVDSTTWDHEHLLMKCRFIGTCTAKY